MSTYLIKGETLTDIAKAIRSGKGTTDLINPTEFAEEITTLLNNVKNVVERDVTHLDIPNGATKIGVNALANYTTLVSAKIPDSVTTIGSQAFAYDSALKTVTFGKDSKLSVIDNFAFRESGLESIVLPDSLTRIEYYAFLSCVNLSQVTLSNNLHTLGSDVFRSCTSLTEIFFPKSVISIYDRAFQGCSNCLKYDFSTHTSIPVLSGANVFSGINANAKIIVPENLFLEWIRQPNWTSLATQITTLNNGFEVLGYIANEGMTWRDWVYSDYSKGKFEIRDGSVWEIGGYQVTILDNGNFFSVSENALIIKGVEYIIS